jgi:epsilon-lactone hydrolase
MPSFKSKIILNLLLHRHLFKFKLHRPAFDGSIDGILRFRKETESAGIKFGKLPKDTIIAPVQIGDMYAEWVKTPEAPVNKAILYFHGGMYLIGSPPSHRVHVIKFVKGSNINALVFDYGLAPENPFPKGLNDAVMAYQYLLDQGLEPKHIVFAGDSAGAGLCLATLLALKDRKIQLPAAAAVLSPWTDLTLSGSSYEQNKHSCLSPIGSAEAASAYYAGSHDRRNPLISPLFGDLSGLPPLHISVGGNEILLDDSVQFALKAQEAGVAVTFMKGEGMCHCYPAFGNLLPEAKVALDDICSFLARHSS